MNPFILNKSLHTFPKLLPGLLEMDGQQHHLSSRTDKSFNAVKEQVQYGSRNLSSRIFCKSMVLDNDPNCRALDYL